LNGNRYERVYVLGVVSQGSVTLGESFLSLIVISPLVIKEFFDYLNNLEDFSKLIRGALEKLKQNVEPKCKKVEVRALKLFEMMKNEPQRIVSSEQSSTSL
jgi:hypothetical protein